MGKPRSPRAIDDGPYHRLKRAAAAQRELDLHVPLASGIPEPTHPATALAAAHWDAREGATAAAPQVPPTTTAKPAGSDPTSNDQGPASPSDHVPGGGFALPQDKTSEPFYPLVPVRQDRATADRAAHEERLAALLQVRTRAAREPFVAQIGFQCTRPRALLAVIVLVVLGVVGSQAIATYRATAQPPTRLAAHREAMNPALGLLDIGTGAAAVPGGGATSAAVAGIAQAGDAAAGAGSASVAGSAEEYVHQVLPPLTGEQKAPGSPDGLPPAVRNRPLPQVKVPATQGSGARSPVAKAPIGTHIDEGEGSTPASGARRPVGNRVTSPIHPADPLAHVPIRATVTRSGTPFAVRAVRSGAGRREALVALTDTRAEPSWVGAGHVFANGWTLVGMEGDRVLFLSPDTRVVTVKPSVPPSGSAAR